MSLRFLKYGPRPLFRNKGNRLSGLAHVSDVAPTAFFLSLSLAVALMDRTKLGMTAERLRACR